MDNNVLVKKYPFLKLQEQEENKWTWLDFMPNGWRKAFGLEMVNEINEVLKEDELKVYTIMQIKEKYGSLRWYDIGGNEKIEEIIDKYEEISKRVCIVCGEKAIGMSKGWLSPYCEKHMPKNTEYTKVEDYK